MTQELNLKKWKTMPAAEQISAELSTARSMDDFFGRDGIFARLFARTLEEMLEAELTGDEPVAVIVQAGTNGPVLGAAQLR